MYFEENPIAVEQLVPDIIWEVEWLQKQQEMRVLGNSN